MRAVAGAQLIFLEFVACRISRLDAIGGFLSVSLSWVFRNAFLNVPKMLILKDTL